MTDPQQTPAEALESIRQSRAAVADRMGKTSWTYDVIYSSITAVMIAGQVAPLPFNIFASAGGACAFAFLARKWAQKTGVFVSGVTPKRARWVAVGLGGVVAVLMLAALWAGRAHHAWMAIPLGLIGFVAATIGSRLWMRVFRAEIQDLT